MDSTTLQFQKATKFASKLRMAIIGPSGSGKTFTSLTLARGLVGDEGRIAVIDTERGSASKYADLFSFDVLELTDFSPDRYIAALQAAQDAGYDAAIIDSLSHGWSGKGGTLEMVDEAARRSRSSNSFMAWRDVTPKHNALVDAMLKCDMHLFVTMRTKTEYVIEEVNGKKVPRKVGMQPVQRDGMEYEFDIVADMDHEHVLVVSKSRAYSVADTVVKKPDVALADKIGEWLTGEEPPEPVHAETLSTAVEEEDIRKAEAWDEVKVLCERCEKTRDDLRDFIAHRFAGKTGKDLTAGDLGHLIDAMGREWEEVAHAVQQ